MKSEMRACGCGQCTAHEGSGRSTLLCLWSSFLILTGGLLCQYFDITFFHIPWVRPVWFGIGWLPVGLPVMGKAWDAIRKKDFFNEFTLMGLASAGAFYIGEYPEAVAVMLFYSVGEMWQERAVEKARNHIKSLIDMRPRTATVSRHGRWQTVMPEEVGVGEVIEVKVGERIPLDGVLLDAAAAFDTAALTGESVPRMIGAGEEVPSGLIPSGRVVRLRTLRGYADSALSRILEMVEHAASHKAPAEQFIRRFSRVYTPVVSLWAILLVILPFFYALFTPDFDYKFQEWLYRALVFLVISCPCALVVSIPLGYFGGIGSASRRGILFKGGHTLDALAHVNTVVFDKTGTLTRGVFHVREVCPADGFTSEEILAWAAAAEAGSNHPIARAVCDFAVSKFLALPPLKDIGELAGLGLNATGDKGQILVGRLALLRRYGVQYPEELAQCVETLVAVALAGRYAGHLVLADELKSDAAEAVSNLRQLGIKHLCILSGDKTDVVKKLASELGVTCYAGDLMPQDKVRLVEDMRRREHGRVSFVGDGLNDAPVLAASHAGIAMGGSGSDVAIEAAGIVLQTDSPLKVAEAIRLARRTRRVVWQNITGAVGMKLLVLVLGAVGMATLWAAVFADVGVALLAILNAVRLLSDKKY